MENKSLDQARAATYEAMRNDLRGSQRTKTKKKVVCTPPNVQCGGRCIPPTWDCRLKGEGTNSELKVHSQDISKGGSMLISGTRDVVKGIATLNPVKFEQGRSRAIRGAVKVAPGNNLEEKKQLRKKLEQNSSLIAATTFLGIGVAGAYATSRKYMPPALRDKIETPAKNAYNAVLDRAPFIGARRERNRQAGEFAATTLGGAVVSGARQQAVNARAAGNTGGIGPLSFRGRSANTLNSNLTTDLDRINKENRSFDSWKTEATQALFGAKTPKGNSIYSERAANEYLTTQFKLSNGAVARDVRGPRGGNGGGDTQSVRNTAVEADLAKKLTGMGVDMKRDMQTRGIVSQETYVKQVALPAVGRKLGGLSASQRKAGLVSAEATINAAMGGSTTSKARAKALRQSAVEDYNTYFSGVSTAMSRFGGSPMNRDSPLGDGATALARFEIGRKTGSTPQILSRGHGDLLLREHYHTRVAKSKTGYIVGEGTAKRVAQTITRSSTTPTTEAAFKILNTNGFPNAQRGTAGSTQTGTSSVPKTAKTGIRRQQSIGSLAKSIMSRKGNEGMSQAAALRAAKRELEGRKDNRGDDEHTGPSITKRNPPSPVITNSPEDLPMEQVLGEVIPKNEKVFVESLTGSESAPVQSLASAPDPMEAEHPEELEKAKAEAKPIEIEFKLKLPISAIKQDEAIPPRVAAYMQMKAALQ